MGRPKKVKPIEIEEPQEYSLDEFEESDDHGVSAHVAKPNVNVKELQPSLTTAETPPIELHPLAYLKPLPKKRFVSDTKGFSVPQGITFRDLPLHMRKGYLQQIENRWRDKRKETIGLAPDQAFAFSLNR